MIDFNVPPFTGKELEYMQQAIKNKKICGDGEFTKKQSLDGRKISGKSCASDDFLYPRPGDGGGFNPGETGG